MEEHFGEALGVDRIAREAHYSKFHFIRLFRKIYGLTPGQYLTRIRVAKARVMLAGGCRVGDACYAAGFTSISSFSTLFRTLEGASPGAFRRRERLRLEAIGRKSLNFIPFCFARAYGALE